jgi:hypothetical protein
VKIVAGSQSRSILESLDDLRFRGSNRSSTVVF